MTAPNDAWSRRKARVREEAAAEARARKAEETRQREAALAEKPEAQVLADLGLPAPEAMQPGDDFSAFLSDRVPVALRNRALRRLWLTDPALANLDDLLEYGEDFTGAIGQGAGMVTTAYRVGKGFLAPDAEPAAKATGETPQAAPEDETAAARRTENAEAGPAVTSAPADAEAAALDRPARRAAPRHMQFHFDQPDAPATGEASA